MWTWEEANEGMCLKVRGPKTMESQVPHLGLEATGSMGRVWA